MTDLADFRADVDDFLQFHPQSPLEDAQRADFQGLEYFDTNDDLILEVELERFPDDEPLIEMTTNTGDKQLYKRWARFTFEVDGQETALTVYSDCRRGARSRS